MPTTNNQQPPTNNKQSFNYWNEGLSLKQLKNYHHE